MNRTLITKHGVTLQIDMPPTDEAHVTRLEVRLGCPLPEDYREFLLLYNGGRPEPGCFQFAQRTGPYTDSVIDWFLTLHENPYTYTNLERKLDVFADRIPPGTLPIANDPGGNCVLLGLNADIRGKVYFWDHDREPARQPDWSNIDLIAEDFDTFMRKLIPLEELLKRSKS